MDCFSVAQRSKIMSSVRSTHNKSTEHKLITWFRGNKIIGWRRKSNLEGCPDFIFPKLKLAVFTDGCFWHGHNCRNTTPKTNSEFWQKKILKNKNRDLRVTLSLQEKGWKVIRIWECQLKDDSFLRNLFLK